MKPEKTAFKPKRYTRVTLRKFNIQKLKCQRKYERLQTDLSNMRVRVQTLEDIIEKLIASVVYPPEESNLKAARAAIEQWRV